MSNEALGGVNITAREIYDKLSELVIQMSGVPAKLENHDRRIFDLERKVWVMAGIAAAGGGGVTAAIMGLFGGGS